MASKRTLKKSINYVCSELFAECVANSLYNMQKNNSDVEAMLHSILTIHSNYVSRVSHPEPGISARAYYTDLTQHFNAEISEVIDQIANMN